MAFTVHTLLGKGGRSKLQLSNLQCVLSVIAGAAHDFRHPGTTNAYLINTKDPLAVTYNDQAVCESMHVSEFFKLLYTKESLLTTYYLLLTTDH